MNEFGQWLAFFGLFVATLLLGVVIGFYSMRGSIEQACLKKGYAEINESLYKCSLDTEMEVINLIKKGVNG